VTRPTGAPRAPSAGDAPDGLPAGPLWGSPDPSGPVEVAAGRVEELPAGSVRLLEAAGRRVAVGNAGGELFALDDTCLHRGGSLACGHLDGQVLVCPMHWWRYDVRSGRRLGRPELRLARYPVRVVDGEVRVTVPPAPPARPWRELLLEHARQGRPVHRGASLAPPGPPAVKALVLDFGGPVLVTPFERVAALERSLGVPPGTFAWRGPFDPAGDPLWRAVQAGELGEPAYWAARAAEVAKLSGEPGVPAMMARLFDGPETELVRPEARDLVAAARRRGLATAVLTNDLHDFHDQVWIDRLRILAEVGHLVDAARHGTRKPDPGAYRLVLDRLGVGAGQALFVDDQPANTAGAEAAGMRAVWFDVTRPDHSYATVRLALGLAGDDGGDA
jgi:putative hydrolase of the HAD superfamily